MAKKTITPAERLQLIGLTTIAAQHTEWINKIRESIYELLGSSDEDDKRGFISDLVWDSDRTADWALEGLGITVKETTDADS